MFIFYLQGNVGDFGEEGRAGVRVCCLNVKKNISVIWVHGEDSLALLSCLFYNFFCLHRDLKVQLANLEDLVILEHRYVLSGIFAD